MAVICDALLSAAAAETVSVKYRGPVPLDTFQCATIDRSSLVKRVCYDAAQRYMVILLKGRVPRAILNDRGRNIGMSPMTVPAFYPDTARGIIAFPAAT